MKNSLIPGRLVISTAGRDEGKFYLVLDLCPDNKVNVVDGDMRKISNPKRKNSKHLRSYPEISQEINQKVTGGLKVSDQDVRRALEEMIANYT